MNCSRWMQAAVDVNVSELVMLVIDKLTICTSILITAYVQIYLNL